MGCGCGLDAPSHPKLWPRVFINAFLIREIRKLAIKFLTFSPFDSQEILYQLEEGLTEEVIDDMIGGN